MKHYGIKFSGPIKKNIWWKADGPYGNRILTFTDINKAYEWTVLRKELWPYCQYVVEEVPREILRR